MFGITVTIRGHINLVEDEVVPLQTKYGFRPPTKTKTSQARQSSSLLLTRPYTLFVFRFSSNLESRICSQARGLDCQPTRRQTTFENISHISHIFPDHVIGFELKILLLQIISQLFTTVALVLVFWWSPNNSCFSAIRNFLNCASLLECWCICGSPFDCSLTS